jgi:hypothetical protein
MRLAASSANRLGGRASCSLAVALAQGSLELSACLARLTALNMRAHAMRFTAALAAGAILPDDF